MLFEIFDDHNYEETVCDPEKGIESCCVPKTIISEIDENLRSLYKLSRDFLVNVLDKPEFNLRHGGHYMLEIDLRKDTANANNCTAYRSKVKTFDFKFAVGNIQINGFLKIDGNQNIIEYHRDTKEEDLVYTTSGTILSSPKFVHDPTSTSGSKVVYEKEYLGKWGKDIDSVTTQPPFAERGQQPGEVDSSEEQPADRGEVNSPINLSGNSFAVEEGIIEVKDPELEIGKVEDRSFSIDADKQAMQDAFLKTLNDKIRRARRSK